MVEQQLPNTNESAKVSKFKTFLSKSGLSLTRFFKNFSNVYVFK
jgi:hypothetical protein